MVPRRTVKPLTEDELHSPDEARLRQVFDKMIEMRFGKPVANNSIKVKGLPPATCADEEKEEIWESYTDEEEPAHEVPDMDDAVDARGLLINQQPEYDQFLNLTREGCSTHCWTLWGTNWCLQSPPHVEYHDVRGGI